MTPEQLFKTTEGHIPRLASLLRERQFVQRLRRIVVDEVQFIHTAGISNYGLPAFRRSYGRLNEIKALLGTRVPWLVLTATAPPQILKTVEATVLRPSYLTLRITSNRPNITYATHKIVGSINNHKNFQCFITQPYSPVEQPRVLIFRDSLAGTVQLARSVDDFLPVELRRQGIVRHYHSSMSPEYMENAHRDFTTEDGNCKILVATSGESVVCLVFAVF